MAGSRRWLGGDGSDAPAQWLEQASVGSCWCAKPLRSRPWASRPVVVAITTTALPGSEAWPPSSAPWSGRIAVLVTTLDEVAFPAVALARLYRERADAENIYDELKNQWGWNGFTTRKLGPCRLMANLVALVYNWWHLYVRLYDAEHHREAITSRPALLGGVARLIRHGGQRTVKVSLQHENREQIVAAITQVSNTLHRFAAIAERWTHRERWSLLLTHIFRHWLGGKWLGTLPPEAELLLSG